MVRDGFGDESGAKLIDQRGIDFAPSEDFYQTLKAAGASEAFLKALRAAQPPEPAGAKKPLNQVQVFALLAGQVPSHRVTMPDQERGQENQYAAAEQEYRAALLLDFQNDDLYVSLADVLSQQEKWDDAASAAREALRLNPNNDMARSSLGVVLGGKGDTDGMIAEEREALRVNPNNDMAHAALGAALEKKGDRRGALEEYRAAYTLDPKDATYKKEYESAIQRQAATAIPAKPTVSALLPQSSGEVLASAKTLCIVQENGSPVVKAEVEKKLLKWGHLTLVSSVNESDLVLVIAQTGQLNIVSGEGNQPEVHDFAKKNPRSGRR